VAFVSTNTKNNFVKGKDKFIAGCALRPFVYKMALDQGYELDHIVSDIGNTASNQSQ
jgi:hypothetical protein